MDHAHQAASSSSSSSSTMASFVHRFRNAPPRPSEEREKVERPMWWRNSQEENQPRSPISTNQQREGKEQDKEKDDKLADADAEVVESHKPTPRVFTWEAASRDDGKQSEVHAPVLGVEALQSKTGHLLAKAEQVKTSSAWMCDEPEDLLQKWRLRHSEWDKPASLIEVHFPAKLSPPILEEGDAFQRRMEAALMKKEIGIQVENNVKRVQDQCWQTEDSDHHGAIDTEGKNRNPREEAAEKGNLDIRFRIGGLGPKNDQMFEAMVRGTPDAKEVVKLDVDAVLPWKRTGGPEKQTESQTSPPTQQQQQRDAPLSPTILPSPGVAENKGGGSGAPPVVSSTEQRQQQQLQPQTQTQTQTQPEARTPVPKSPTRLPASGSPSSTGSYEDGLFQTVGTYIFSGQDSPASMALRLRSNSPMTNFSLGAASESQPAMLSLTQSVALQEHVEKDPMLLGLARQIDDIALRIKEQKKSSS